jgi:hypothetical protein
MRAVWSFWSKPFHTSYGRIWCKPLHHLLAWGLSVRTARRHFSETVLITDKPGRTLLVDQLGLQFSKISTELERLNDVDPNWWSLGKLVAYSLQDRPFVHLDSDVFLWKRLPSHLLDAPVLTQHPEGFGSDDHSIYRPRDIEWAFAQQSLRLPLEWEWTRSNRRYFPADNCGIVGGTHVEFLRYYARTAIDLITSADNAPAWSRLQDKCVYNIVLEQFLLSACAEFHASHRTSRFHGVRICHLFPTWKDAFDPGCAARVGYTHLIAGAKSHASIGNRLEDRMRREDPTYYWRCESVLQHEV